MIKEARHEAKIHLSGFKSNSVTLKTALSWNIFSETDCLMVLFQNN